MRLHRPEWWHDGDQDFLAEWVDPSADLDFRRTLELRRELFDPILRAIGERFGYQGPARAYYQRAIDEQIEICQPRRYLHTLGMWHLWRQLVGESPEPNATADHDEPPAGDDELRELARQARRAELGRGHLQNTGGAIAAALEQVPRERFVRLEDIGQSSRDIALGLTDDGGSTISAMHAYARAFEALELGPGDDLIDLGGGTGYGAALAAELIKPSGKVLAIELMEQLVERGRSILAELSGGRAELVAGDAHCTERWAGARKIYVGFALPELPASWLAALAPDGRLVAPISDAGGAQMLTLFSKQRSGAVERTELGPVVYVVDRRATG